MAIGKQCLACLICLCGWHVLYLREDGHGMTAVLHQGVEVVVVQFVIVRKEGRQHTLDAERATHGGTVAVTITERYEQVDDIAMKIHQVGSEVGVRLCHLLDASLFEGVVICHDATVHRDVVA